MKKIIYLLPLILTLACNTTTKKDVSSTEQEAPVVTQESKTKPATKTISNSTYLCKINGVDWAYTKASGIIDKHRKTGVRTAIVTFKKKLEKGSESIQLHYNADTFALEAVSLQLKFKKKDGKVATCFYDLKPATKKRSPESKMTGKIDISNPSKAAGYAKITNININYEKETLLNTENATINVTSLKFDAIGYSDIDKLSNAFKK